MKKVLIFLGACILWAFVLAGLIGGFMNYIGRERPLDGDRFYFCLSKLNGDESAIVLTPVNSRLWCEEGTSIFMLTEVTKYHAE